jgi:hypothetical protein
MSFRSLGIAALVASAAAQLPTPPCSQVRRGQARASALQSARALLPATRAALPPSLPLQYDPTKKLETPCNIELKNTTRYQIRVYGVGGVESWSTATVQATSYASATSKGFGDNFQYIEGANANKTKIPMTVRKEEAAPPPLGAASTASARPGSPTRPLAAPPPPRRRQSRRARRMARPGR